MTPGRGCVTGVQTAESGGPQRENAKNHMPGEVVDGRNEATHSKTKKQSAV
ncbi:hypothetical protein OKW40_002440 [Paraburkholderia sp. RAU6.4a]